MSQDFNFNAESFKVLSIEIFPCFITNEPNCHGVDAFFDLLNAFYNTFTYGFVELYVLNTGFNVEQKDHIYRFMDSNHWLTFSENIGTDLIIQLGSYSVETDTTMMPLEMKET